MKTAKEFIKNINNVEFDGKGDPLYSYDQLLLAMKEYALQEVKKHLEIASENAVIDMPSHSHFHRTKNVIKSSITDIQINLS